MAELKDIIDKERQREGRQEFLTVHLYQDGSFYRAYDWSAWLCVNYIKSDMKVTHRKAKTKDIDFAFVGFPITSVEKYTPADAVAVRLSDKAVDIQLGVELIDASVSFDTLSDAVEKWKEGIPLTKPLDRKSDKELYTDVSPEVSEIMKEILAYPIESKSLIENTIFISNIKEKLTKTI